MRLLFIKNVFTYILCLNILFGFCFQAFAQDEDFTVEAEATDAYRYKTDIIKSNTYKIGSGINFTARQAIDTNLNNQRSYIIEFGADEFSDMFFLGADNLNQRNSINALVENLDLSSGHIVAAMNGDFFNMSNGIPESAFIRDGVLLTSDRDNYVFAKNSEGEFFFDKPSVKISVSFNEKTYNVLHFNKEFTEYGLYIYNSEFGAKTNINVPATELVLFPYTQILDVYEICELFFDSDVPYDAIVEEYNQETEEYIETINEDYIEEIKAFLLQNNILEYNGKYYFGAGSDVVIGNTYNAVIIEKRENTDSFSNEIIDGTFILSAKTETQGFKLESAEEGMDVTITVDANERFYDVVSAIGTGAIIVEDSKEVEHNELSHYSSAQPRTAIGLTEDNRVIMYAADGRNANISKGLTLKELSCEMIDLGCVIAANLDGGGSTTVKVLSANEGDFVTYNNPSDATERKISNAIAFYNMLEPTGIPAYTYFDSQSMYVLPNSFVTLENPLFFDTAFYPVNLYSKLYPNEPEQEENETADCDVVDETQEQNTRMFPDGFTYYVDDDKGKLVDFKYSPEGYIGKAQIISQKVDGFQNTAYEIISVDKLDKVNITTESTSIYVGDSIDFDAEGYIHNAKVCSEDYEFIWNVDSSYGIITQEGVFSAFNAGENVEVSAKFGETEGKFFAYIKELPFFDIDGHWAKKDICTIFEAGISIGELTELGRLYFPQRNFTRAEFCVMLSRLLGLTVAADTVVLQDTGVVSNEYDETSQDDVKINDDNKTDITSTDEILNQHTKIEDVISDDNNNEANDTQALLAEEYKDLSDFYSDFDTIPEWAKQSVNELYKLGLLDEYFHSGEHQERLFDASVPVMRGEVISLIGRLLPAAEDEFSFELVDVSEDDENFNNIKNVLYHGVFKGYPDKTLKLEQNLTRAEIAVVFNRLNEIEIGQYIFS